MAEPAYTRMPVDERRRQLLELRAELFARHSFAELSMARIAREAGISKALLYHYFPSKQELFVAALARPRRRCAGAPSPIPALPPAEALAASLDAFLAWVEENELAYRKLLESAGSVPEVGRADRPTCATAPPRASSRAWAPAPSRRCAPPCAAWLWFMDGAILDWLDHRDLERESCASCCWARWGRAGARPG